MIFGNNQATESYRTQLETLERNSVLEQSSNGFEYFVAEADNLTHPKAITGLVIFGPDEIELNLLMGSDIDPAIRPKIADMTVEMASMGGQGLPSEYLLCDAGQRLMPDWPLETRLQIGSTLFDNLKSFKKWVRQQDSSGNYKNVHPRDRAQLKHSLGWVALERKMSDSGLEVVNNLIDLGLNVLPVGDKEVLTAQGKGKLNGVGMTVYSAREKGHHHRCKSCSGDIHRGTTRVTASYDKKVHGYDHHHYHPVCYAETDMKQIDLSTAKFIKSEFWKV